MTSKIHIKSCTHRCVLYMYVYTIMRAQLTGNMWRVDLIKFFLRSWSFKPSVLVKITLPSCHRLREQDNQRFGPSSSVKRRPFKNRQSHGAIFSFWKVYFISTKLQLACECMSLSLLFPPSLFLAILYLYVKNVHTRICQLSSPFRTFIDEDKDKMNLEEEVKKGSIL